MASSVFEVLPVWPAQPLWMPCAVLACYWLLLAVLQRWMVGRPAFNTSALVCAHNVVLTVMSTVLTLGLGRAAWKIWSKHSLFELYCGATPELDAELLAWINWFYLSKYYELLDTVLLVLKKKELGFLHVYHHSSVLLLFWFTVEQQIQMSFLTSLNNAFVHIAMYYYYAIQALGQTVWWKKHLTNLQMLQFMLDNVTSLPFLYYYYHSVPCRGTLVVWATANVTCISYFLLFLRFHAQTYGANAPARQQQQLKRQE